MIQYRLIGKKQPATFSMKINGAMGLKNTPNGLMSKEIGYYKGFESPFSEDVIKLNKQAKKSRPPMFTFKKHINATTLDVKETDISLIKFVESHEDFGKKFERYSESVESERKLSEYDVVEKALDVVNENDEHRIKALGLCIIGFETYGKETTVIRRQLKELAFNSPNRVLDEYNNPNFDNKLLVSLAFCGNIIETDSNQTSIQWVSGKGRILGIATGEDSVFKMTEFISSNSPESIAVMQEIGKRLDKIITKKAMDAKEDNKVKRLEDRIKELEYKLSGQTLVSVEMPPMDYDLLTLEEAQSLYKERFKKLIPLRYKHNLDWIKEQLMKNIEVIEPSEV